MLQRHPSVVSDFAPAVLDQRQSHGLALRQSSDDPLVHAGPYPDVQRRTFHNVLQRRAYFRYMIRVHHESVVIEPDPAVIEIDSVEAIAFAKAADARIILARPGANQKHDVGTHFPKRGSVVEA